MSRVVSHLLVSALLRRVADEGGSGAVLARGDPDAGEILLLARDRGTFAGLFERANDKGRRKWSAIIASAAQDEATCAAYLDRRRTNDRDLWIVELDIANSPRFILESAPGA